MLNYIFTIFEIRVLKCLYPGLDASAGRPQKLTKVGTVLVSHVFSNKYLSSERGRLLAFTPQRCYTYNSTLI